MTSSVQGRDGASVRWNRRVRLVLADVDETIAGLYEPASPAMLRALGRFLGDGGRLFLITGGSLQRVTSGITDGIPRVMRRGVLVAPVSGAEVWGFTTRGAVRRRPFVSRYEETFTPDMKRRWRAVSAQVLAEFGLRPHAVRPPARFHREVGHDPLDVMVDDRGSQITFEFVNGRDLRVAVVERAAELLREARLPVTPRLASVFALNMTIEGVSKESAVRQVLESDAILASVGLTSADVAAPHALEVWGDDFSAANGGSDLLMSRAVAPAVRSIDFRDEDPTDFPAELNIVLWDGAQRLHDGLLEYLESRRA